MGTAPLTFTGVSQFSTDFQTILSHALQVAQIPVTALQNKDSQLLQQKTLLSTLNSAVSDLATSLGSLGTIGGTQAISASSSDPNAVSVTATGATSSVSYTINSITSAASVASERTLTGLPDSTTTPVSSTGTVRLVVGSQHYDLTLANNSLVGLRDQINAQGAGVTASILTTSGANYLSISANQTGATPLQLLDDPSGANTNLLTATNQGTNAVFELNGIPVSQAGNVVNSVIPGVTFNILGASTDPVTLTLSSDPSQLSSALKDFATKYNALRTQLNAQVGPAAGLLSGDLVIRQLQSELRQIGSYRTSTGTVQSLTDLGIEFSNTGEASFNQTTFNALSQTQIADGFAFLGSATTGFGAFSSRLQEYSDPITGLIRTEQDGIDRTDSSIQTQIATLTDRINATQASLAAKLQVADALAAQLESQQKALDASLQGLSLVLYGRSQSLV